MDTTESSEGTSSSDAKSTGPIESPFKLIKVKGTVPSFALNAGPRATSPTLKNSGFENLASPTSPTPPSIPSLNPISLNPFSLSKLKKTTPVNGTTIPRISPLSGMGKEAPVEQQVAELQNEVACLKKEIESKDAKLSSSMRSIKMFWSPELKKERAAHKDDVERMLLMKNQCDSLQAEIKRLKSGNGSSDSKLEKELPDGLQKFESASGEKTVELHALNEALNQELEEMEKKFSDLELNFKIKTEQYLEKEAEIMALNHEVEKLKLKETEKICIEDGMALVEEELSKVRNELKLKEKEVERLFKEVSAAQKESDSSSNTLKIKESVNEELQTQLEQMKEENTSLVNSFDEAEKRCITLQDELQQKNCDVKELERMTNNLRSELESSVEERDSLKNTLEGTRSKILGLVDDLEKAKRHVGNKEEELNELRDEVD